MKHTRYDLWQTNPPDRYKEWRSPLFSTSVRSGALVNKPGDCQIYRSAPSIRFLFSSLFVSPICTLCFLLLFACAFVLIYRLLSIFPSADGSLTSVRVSSLRCQRFVLTRALKTLVLHPISSVPSSPDSIDASLSGALSSSSVRAPHVCGASGHFPPRLYLIFSVLSSSSPPSSNVHTPLSFCSCSSPSVVLRREFASSAVPRRSSVSLVRATSSSLRALSE